MLIQKNLKCLFILLGLLLTAGCAKKAPLAPGDLAPDFRLNTIDNKRFYLNEHAGKVVMLNFWAPWCSVCKTEMVHLEKIYTKYKNNGFVLAGINTEEQDVDGAKVIAQEYRLTYPVLTDSKTRTVKLYGVEVLPHTVLIDRKQKVRFIHSGFKESDIRIITEEIELLLKEEK
ncbi:MAG: hypothetical protein A2298_00150 [Gammaproteobacteria bacterium RIFOXYB2_FULL_38_6]|nr:MAG: hypothetical protein A2252_04085 [Elusimicrobia bacterium RIFOXYA2_FULL_39_19]OGT93313.1 MAG: hypothetical protein A2298_00150 [Gammaproteobacteria bacterium RIFOXYB2_FULL_38_6]